MATFLTNHKYVVAVKNKLNFPLNKRCFNYYFISNVCHIDLLQASGSINLELCNICYWENKDVHQLIKGSLELVDSWYILTNLS